MRPSTILSRAKRRASRSNRVYPIDTSNHIKLCYCDRCKRRRNNETKFVCKCLVPFILIIIGLSFI